MAVEISAEQPQSTDTFTFSKDVRGLMDSRGQYRHCGLKVFVYCERSNDISVIYMHMK